MRARWLIVAAIVVLACAGTLSLWFVRGGSPELSVEDEARVDAIVEAAMSRSTTTGLSLAIAHQGRLVFAKAYGAADRGEPLTTKHRFRLASVSKPLTAIEIMRLVDGGRLRLDDRVFGEGSLLGERYVASSRFADPRVRSITVGQLLEHTAGGWDNDAQDGTLDPLIVQPRLDRDRWLSWILRNVKLEHEPGTVFQYSNFGYAVLGRVIEQVTRRSYAETMRADVFRPARAESFALAGGSRSERLPGEVAYTQVGAHTDAPYELPLERMDAHGGWVATPTDLLRVAVRADGFTDVADLLSSMALATMTTPGMARAADGRPADYAKGWAVNDVPNWWHTGDLPGTSSLLVRTANRYGSSGREAFTWAAITNSTNAQPRAALNLDELMWRIVRSVEAWPEGDGI